MLRKKHHLKITIPIPPHIQPSAVLKALYDHPTVFKHQSFVREYNIIPSIEIPHAVRKDCHYFHGDHDGPNNIVTWQVAEEIPMLPGGAKWANKMIRFLVRCQNIEQGIKCQANAPGGVVVRSTYSVVDREEQEGDPFAFGQGKIADGTTSLDGLSRDNLSGLLSRPDSRDEKLLKRDGLERLMELEKNKEREGRWDLVEETEVECNVLMMGFVAGSMETAHREICQKILKELESGGQIGGAETTDGSDVGAATLSTGGQSGSRPARPASYVPPREYDVESERRDQRDQQRASLR